MSKIRLVDTGERMVPEFHKGGLIYAEHLTRYDAAKVFTKGKVVLDIASGSGYGTKLLAENAKHVYGVDVSEEAVEYSKQNFSAENIEYLTGSGTKIPLKDNSVDVVVTFETIEHIDDYEQFLDEVTRVLKDDGVAIVSTPNELEFAEGNHFHLHEFEYEELNELLLKHFKNIEAYFQATWKAVAVATEMQLNNERLEVELSNYAPLTKDKFLYFYLVCSNSEVKQTIKPLVALGEHYSERAVLHELEQVHEKERVIKVREKEYAELQEYAESLQEETKRLESLVHEKQKEVDEIQNSRSYKLVNSVSKAKSKVSKAVKG